MRRQECTHGLETRGYAIGYKIIIERWEALNSPIVTRRCRDSISDNLISPMIVGVLATLKPTAKSHEDLVSPRSTPGFSGISWVIDHDESLARSSVFTVYIPTVCTHKYLDWYIGSR